MARIKNAVVMRGTTGTFGKEVVFKIRKGQPYVSARPDTSNIIPTDNQILNRSNFADAVSFAKWVVENPGMKLPFEPTKKQTLYQAAISFFRHSIKPEKSAISSNRLTHQKLKEFNLTERQIKAVMYLQKNGTLTNAIYQQLNGVSKATASRDLKELVDKDIITSSGLKGVGAVYRLSFSKTFHEKIFLNV